MNTAKEVRPLEDNKHESIKSLLDTVSKTIAGPVGMKRSEALRLQKCAKCGTEAKDFKDEASVREYKLTAWCQSCQDEFFG